MNDALIANDFEKRRDVLLPQTSGWSWKRESLLQPFFTVTRDLNFFMASPHCGYFAAVMQLHIQTIICNVPQHARTLHSVHISM